MRVFVYMFLSGISSSVRSARTRSSCICPKDDPKFWPHGTILCAEGPLSAWQEPAKEAQAFLGSKSPLS